MIVPPLLALPGPLTKRSPIAPWISPPARLVTEAPAVPSSPAVPPVTRPPVAFNSEAP